MKGIDKVTTYGKDLECQFDCVVYTEAYVNELKAKFEEDKKEVRIGTLQELFLDINKKEPIIDSLGNIYGVKELTLNDVKKIILNKIKGLEDEQLEENTKETQKRTRKNR